MELELEDDAAPILCRLRGGEDELPSFGSLSIFLESLESFLPWRVASNCDERAPQGVDMQGENMQGEKRDRTSVYCTTHTCMFVQVGYMYHYR